MIKKILKIRNAKINIPLFRKKGEKYHYTRDSSNDHRKEINDSKEKESTEEQEKYGPDARKEHREQLRNNPQKMKELLRRGLKKIKKAFFIDRKA